MNKLLNLSYYIDLQPTISKLSAEIFIAIFATMVFLAIASRLAAKGKIKEGFRKKLFEKYYHLLLWLGLSGLLITFFRYEQVYLLSARLWLVIWLVVFVVWLAMVLKYQLKEVPRAQKQLEQAKQFQKYLPKKK